MDSFMATIMLWPLSWVPQGWFFCNGQSLSIQSYSALYTLLGNTYGGDGITTFMLPNIHGHKTVSGAEVNYIICFEGVYPSRA
jgi:microcystin-dependent protein